MMKALIRNLGEELITETMPGITIDWNTGAPLTDPDWYGGPYTLIADFHMSDIPEEEMLE